MTTCPPLHPLVSRGASATSLAGSVGHTPTPGSGAGGPVRPGCTGLPCTLPPAPRLSARPLKGVELKWRSQGCRGSRWVAGCLTPSALCGFTGELVQGPCSMNLVCEGHGTSPSQVMVCLLFLISWV